LVTPLQVIVRLRPQRMILSGDSAGGNLAIATAMLLQQPQLSSPDSSHFSCDALSPLAAEMSARDDACACFKLAAEFMQQQPAAASSMSAFNAAAPHQPASQLVALLILYPCLDPTRSGTSHTLHAASPTLAAAELQWFWQQYLAGCSAEARGSCLSRPLHAGDDILRALPPIFIATAGQDPLCDDGFALATRLQVAKRCNPTAHQSAVTS
jgi:acetyl esterase/lipase